MIKVMAFIKRRPDISHEEFRQHYEREHAPKIRNIASVIISYRRNYPMPQLRGLVDQFHRARADGRSDGHDGPDAYDAITEVWLENESALREMYRLLSHESKDVHMDEDRFLDNKSLRVIVAEEVVTDLKPLRA